MTGKFFPIQLPGLLRLTLSEIRNDRFMGIPGSLFFHPEPKDPFRMMRYGRELETPVGVAAGPHTQLALNIIAAWLCGARYIELKTVQALDELEVSKPCIDMQDEGYNCEWSQELKIRESFTEYLNAWIIIHILRRELGFSAPSGTLFNMSVGYDLEGILKENVQWFLERMLDCSAELTIAKKTIREIYPTIDEIDIPSCISNHITLSTMHGCPPDEIEKIGLYLIREKKLHTTIKLNPTLLGADELRQLLNIKMGFSAVVPDLAFEHDLKYPDALKLIDSLKKASDENGLQFGIKLTNTLESANNKDIFSSDEKMMYLSGRALHPISIKLARKLQDDMDGKLDISFSAGVDCFNISDVIACGMKPVTVCSDLLKPGGYGRLYQYIDNLRKDFASKNAENIDEYILKVADSGTNSATGSALLNLNRYADRVADNTAYHKKSFTDPSIKTVRPLDYFDCIHAPCIDTCPTNQDIPEYIHHVSQRNIPAAFETIFRTNPFPSVTGMVCDHLCQLKCTRINYDEALQIREIKRFVSENYKDTNKQVVQDQDGETSRLGALAVKKDGFVDTDKVEIVNTRVCPKTAIIGAGPAGLSCAWFLNKAGFEVHLFEQKSLAGGMVSAAIPSFRLTSEAIENDIQRILDSGVHLHDNYAIDKTQFAHLMQDYDTVFLAAGAQKSVRFKIDGVDSTGVIDPLEFLFNVRRHLSPAIGSQVVIIGGGNTAMDAARTAYRLVGEKGSVTIVYRRTIREMPADHGEIDAVREEGIKIIELTNPIRIRSVGVQVTALVCTRNVLAMKGKDGRAIPVAIPDSEFEIPCDTIIPAIGQQLAIDFLEPDQLITIPGNYKTTIPGLYIGGDALRGASTAIHAIADGRKAAEEIISDLSNSPLLLKEKGVEVGKKPKHYHHSELLHRKAIREYGCTPTETQLNDRRNFDLVISSFSEEDAKKEASRCLLCDEICNVCVTVCPNLANFSYRIDPVHYLLQKAVLKEDSTIGFENDIDFLVEQPLQILNIRDLCNECGNCTTFCPSSGRPFFDKPRLCLSVSSLNDEGKGFLLSQLKGKMVLTYKEKENIKTLTLTDGNYVYETDQVRAVIQSDNFNLLDVKFLTPCVKEYHFSFAAEMSTIFIGALKLNNLLNFHS